jgi:hypothetical protein
MALVRKRTIPAGRRLSAKLMPNFAEEGVAWSAQRIPSAFNLGFLDRKLRITHLKNEFSFYV